MRRVLIVNAGSSSLKWLVAEVGSESVLQQGNASWSGTEHDRHEQEFLKALDQVPESDAIGHRVVHGGTRFREAVLVDDPVLAAISELGELAPLHNPAALAGIRAAAARFPHLPQVAAFDTAFHASLPAAAATYPLPWDWTERWSLRRFGFHGLSVQYAVGRAPSVMRAVPRRLVVCHLGAGCSITAVADGRSVDTSMGFTPLEGLMMARRSGSVDPGLLLYLLAHDLVDSAELDSALNERSGLFGVSGISADMRDVLAASEAGSARASLAVDMFVHRIVATVGGMVAILGGLDGLVFTGGIGENSSVIRSRVCSAFAYLGLHLYETLNAEASGTGDVDIAADGSRVRVLVIPAREDLSILREVVRVLGWR
jgi:acetate kinase